jgi:hypothetical protein
VKRKHGNEGTRIKVITDPRKLAWLKAEIAKRKKQAILRSTVKRTV